MAGWLVLCLSVGIIALSFGALNVPLWYAKLVKPPLTPPNALFAVVWPILYALMAVAAWLVWKTPYSTCRFNGLRLFCLQLLFHLLWAWFLFDRHQISVAFLDLAVMWITFLVTMLNFRRVNVTAAWLLVPCLVWMTFVGYLNAGFWRLN
ncbi:MAG: TspO/MBR family protein [Acidobacteriaceae bacterium]